LINYQGFAPIVGKTINLGPEYGI